MAQQVLDGHRALLRLERELGLSGRRIGGLDTDHHVLELGKILVDRGREIELALLDQHHGGDAGDRLGHRGDPEDRIGLQRDGFGTVAKADGSQIGDLAVARDRRNRAREGAGVDLRLLPGSDPRQPRRREAERFRVARRRDVVGAGGGGKAESREAEDRQDREKAMQALHPGVLSIRAVMARSGARHRAVRKDMLHSVALMNMKGNQRSLRWWPWPICERTGSVARAKESGAAVHGVDDGE